MFKGVKEEQLKKLEIFLNLIELDYGDLDVLFDKENNIYICDINNGPMCGEVMPHIWYGNRFNSYLDYIKKMINY